MRRFACILTLFLLLLLSTPAPPAFTARWATPTIARLAWTQPAGIRDTCLSRNAILIRCWSGLPAGPAVVALGSIGPLDGNYRAQAGDVFVLSLDGVRTRAQLRGVVYLAAVQR